MKTHIDWPLLLLGILSASSTLGLLYLLARFFVLHIVERALSL